MFLINRFMPFINRLMHIRSPIDCCLKGYPLCRRPHSRGFVLVAEVCLLRCLVDYWCRRSEFFGLNVKCAEAGWLLEISFHSFLTSSSYFGHGHWHLGSSKFIIWQAWCPHFSTLGAVLAAYGHLEGPWERQIQSHELHSLFLFWLVPWSVVAPMLEWKSGQLKLLNPGFVNRVLQTLCVCTTCFLFDSRSWGRLEN